MLFERERGVVTVRGAPLQGPRAAISRSVSLSKRRTRSLNDVVDGAGAAEVLPSIDLARAGRGQRRREVHQKVKATTRGQSRRVAVSFQARYCSAKPIEVRSEEEQGLTMTSCPHEVAYTRANVCQATPGSLSRAAFSSRSSRQEVPQIAPLS